MMLVVALKLKQREINTFKAIEEYKSIFEYLKPAMAHGVKAKDTSSIGFRSNMVGILTAWELDQIDIYTTIDEILDCFTEETGE